MQLKNIMVSIIMLNIIKPACIQIALYFILGINVFNEIK